MVKDIATKVDQEWVFVIGRKWRKSGPNKEGFRTDLLACQFPVWFIVFPLFFLFSELSPDRGQSQKIRFSKFPGSGLKKIEVNSVFCCFLLGTTDRMLPTSWFSKPIFGHSAGCLNRTGPIANGSDFCFLLKTMIAVVLFLLPFLVYLRWAKSPIASVQRTPSTLAGHSAGPCGTNTTPTNANRAIRIAAQRTQGL